MIYKFVIEVQDRKFRFQEGLGIIDEPKEDSPREWYDNLDQDRISVMFAKEAVVFTSNNLEYLKAFKQGMQYCTALPKYYDDALETPDLASFNDKDKIDQTT